MMQNLEDPEKNIDALCEDLNHACATIAQELDSALESIHDLAALYTAESSYLGKKSRFQSYVKRTASLPSDQRSKYGSIVHRYRVQLQEACLKKKNDLKNQLLSQALQSESIDITLPDRGQAEGGFHPITQVNMKLIRFFQSMNFEVVQGPELSPELESEIYNFDDLNIAFDHPSRAMHDTFYLKNTWEKHRLLRTHTSPVQVRLMHIRPFPIRAVTIGSVYRRDFDMTHTPKFHQMEGLVVDDVGFGHLKFLVNCFLSDFFNQSHIQTRWRPSYFPFTEPSAEVDVMCVMCAGKGCRVCKQTGWIEIMGAGLIHPAVLNRANKHRLEHGYDSIQSRRGLAFGVGIERLAMLQWAVDDIRLFFESDIRFLKQC